MPWKKTYVHARPDEVGYPLERDDWRYPRNAIGRFYTCQVCDDAAPIPEAEVVIRANIYLEGKLTIVCPECDGYVDCDGPYEDPDDFDDMDPRPWAEQMIEAERRRRRAEKCA